MTLAKLAREALDVQNACNLTGVVHSFSRACSALRAALPGADTQTINRHPICVLWAAKIADLTGTDVSTERWADAWEACRALAESDE